MKKIAVVILCVVVVATMVIGSTMVMAKGKPQDVIARSNGFPSGMHFNLNIHGKKADFNCDSTPGGRSIFINEYTLDPNNLPTIEYVSNKNRTQDFPDGTSAYELYVLDPCAMNGGTAKVYLPYKVLVDDTPTVAGGYYVFARIEGKPNHPENCEGKPKDCDPSSIILYPNVVTQACSDESGTHLDCLWTLGLITKEDIYLATEEEFVRFDPQATPGKGKSKAKDITRLFTWSGYVFYGGSPDTNGDEVIDENDIPGDAYKYVRDLDGDPNTVTLYEWQAAHADFNGDETVNQTDLDDAQAGAGVEGIAWPYFPDVGGSAGTDLFDWQAYHPDSDGDGDIDQDDVILGGYSVADLNSDGTVTLEEWLEYHESIGTCTHLEAQWIFDIADLVVSEQKVDNDGAKLLQIRFYPVETTEYVGPGYIVIDKQTVPPDEQVFTFDVTGPDGYSQLDIELNDAAEPWDSGRIQPGTYSIVEDPVSGWSLTNVEIRDPNDNSPGWDGEKYVIYLDPGEVIVVIFTNTQQP